MPWAWGLGFVALVPLMVTVERASRRVCAAAAVAYLVTAVEIDMFGWFAASLRAYFGFAPRAALALAVAFSGSLAVLHAALLALALAWRPPWRGVGNVVWLAAVWAAWESLRAVVPPYVPSAVLGMSQLSAPPLLQLASVTGIVGVTALLVAANAAIAAQLSPYETRRSRTTALAVTLGVLLGVSAWGAARLAGQDEPGPDAPRLLAVDANARDADESTLERWIAATRVPEPARATLIVWPESALPIDLTRDRAAWERLTRFVGERETTLLTGGIATAIGERGRPRRFNAVHLLRPGHGMQSYHKRGLVPFAESWPLWLGAPPAGIDPVAAGRRAVVWNVDGLRVAPLVCFEIMDPRPVRALARNADVLVNVNNDAWFPQGGVPHLPWARVRAVESGRPVLRAANAGISALIDPVGRVTAARSAADGTGTLLATLPPAIDTLYAGIGAAFTPACAAIAIGGIVARGRRLRIRRTPPRSCPR